MKLSHYFVFRLGLTKADTCVIPQSITILTGAGAKNKQNFAEVMVVCLLITTSFFVSEREPVEVTGMLKLILIVNSCFI